MFRVFPLSRGWSRDPVAGVHVGPRSFPVPVIFDEAGKVDCREANCGFFAHFQHVNRSFILLFVVFGFFVGEELRMEAVFGPFEVLFRMFDQLCFVVGDGVLVDFLVFDAVAVEDGD